MTAACSTRNVSLVHGLGADHVIDSPERPLADVGGCYDFILESVGNHRMREPPRRETTIRSFVSVTRGPVAHLPSMVERGELRVVIDRVVPPERAREAMAHLAERSWCGSAPSGRGTGR